MIGPILAPFIVPTSPVPSGSQCCPVLGSPTESDLVKQPRELTGLHLQCAILTPFSGPVSPLSPEFLSLLLFFSSKSKDEVPASGVSQ